MMKAANKEPILVAGVDNNRMAIARARKNKPKKDLITNSCFDLVTCPPAFFFMVQFPPPQIRFR